MVAIVVGASRIPPDRYRCRGVSAAQVPARCPHLCGRGRSWSVRRRAAKMRGSPTVGSGEIPDARGLSVTRVRRWTQGESCRNFKLLNADQIQGPERSAALFAVHLQPQLCRLPNTSHGLIQRSALCVTSGKGGDGRHVHAVLVAFQHDGESLHFPDSLHLHQPPPSDNLIPASRIAICIIPEASNRVQRRSNSRSHALLVRASLFRRTAMDGPLPPRAALEPHGAGGVAVVKCEQSAVSDQLSAKIEWGQPNTRDRPSPRRRYAACWFVRSGSPAGPGIRRCHGER